MIVYYTSLHQDMLDTPYPLMSERNELLFKENSKNIQVTNLNRCPAYIDAFKNLFVLTFPYDYTLEFSDGNIYSKDWNQDFFNKCVLIRESNIKFLSLFLPRAMFFAEKEVELELVHPYLHENDLSKKGKLIPGKYNIGKHLRPLEWPYVFYDDKVVIRRGDPIGYLRFCTNEKIELKRFYCSEEIFNLSVSVVSVRENTYLSKRGLDYYYKLFSNTIGKKYILKKIKENLI